MGLRSPLLPPVAPGEDAALFKTTLFGPTCDGLDTVARDVPLPRLRNGDWVLFPRFGAYTIAGAHAPGAGVECGQGGGAVAGWHGCLCAARSLVAGLGWRPRPRRRMDWRWRCAASAASVDSKRQSLTPPPSALLPFRCPQEPSTSTALTCAAPRCITSTSEAAPCSLPLPTYAAGSVPLPAGRGSAPDGAGGPARRPVPSPRLFFHESAPFVRAQTAAASSSLARRP